MDSLASPAPPCEFDPPVDLLAREKKNVKSARGLKNIPPSTNVFLNYLPNDFTEEDLEMLCGKYGRIQSSKIIIDMKTGQSKCFGFVDFTNIEEADRAIKSLNGKKLRRKRLLVKYACSKVNEKNVMDRYLAMRGEKVRYSDPMIQSDDLSDFKTMYMPEKFVKSRSFYHFDEYSSYVNHDSDEYDLNDPMLNWNESDDMLMNQTMNYNNNNYSDISFSVIAECR